MSYAQMIADRGVSETTAASIAPVATAPVTEMIRKVSVGKEIFAVIIGIILTWVIFWGYLSWDNFSSFYGRSSWASFTAVSKGDGSVTERARATTLFVMQILSVFLLAYSALMFYFSRRNIYMLQLIFAVVLVIVVILSTSLEWLST